mgnify:CR=1 FL=1
MSGFNMSKPIKILLTPFFLIKKLKRKIKDKNASNGENKRN